MLGLKKIYSIPFAVMALSLSTGSLMAEIYHHSFSPPTHTQPTRPTAPTYYTARPQTTFQNSRGLQAAQQSLSANQRIVEHEGNYFIETLDPATGTTSIESCWKCYPDLPD